MQCCLWDRLLYLFTTPVYKLTSNFVVRCVVVLDRVKFPLEASPEAGVTCASPVAPHITTRLLHRYNSPPPLWQLHPSLKIKKMFLGSLKPKLRKVIDCVTTLA